MIIALTSWAASARVLRAQTLSVRNREYVLAARASGERAWRIVLVEILPNELPIIVSNFIFAMIFAILTQAALAFIGLGDPTLLTWGNMLNFAYNDEALSVGAWWWFIPPGLCIALLGMGLALINFSLDELLNPRLRVYRPPGPGGPAGSVPVRPVRSRLVPVERGMSEMNAGPPACVRATRTWSCGPSTSAWSTPGRAPTRAVRDVTLELRRGEVLGIAGESGCGKSTLAYALTRMLSRPPARPAGRSRSSRPTARPVDVLALEGEELRQFRWTKIAMVFQSAMNALNPVTSLARQFDDIFEAHRPQMDRAARQARARELLEMVGIDPARIAGFAHELSGGMRQRVMIAMALALEPEIVIMDEPTTALDVVVQREILDEIERLREELGFSVIFITHDLSLLLEISDRLAVMYAGEVIERAPSELVGGGARRTRTRSACCAPSRTCAARGASCAACPAPRPTCATTFAAARSRPAATTRSSPARTSTRCCAPRRPAGLGSGAWRAADWQVACHLHDPGQCAGRAAAGAERDAPCRGLPC